MSLLIQRKAFDAASATETKTLSAINAQLAAVLSLVLTVEPTVFTGTLDIQGRGDGGTYTNLAYGELDQDGGIQPLVNDQLSLSASSTRRRYLVPFVEPDTQLVLAVTSGTISVWVVGSAMPIPLPR